MSTLNIDLTKAGGVGSIKQENLSSQITAINKTQFVVGQRPKNLKIILTLNGQTLTPGVDKDYTISQNTITINDNNHIDTGDELIVTYIT